MVKEYNQLITEYLDAADRAKQKMDFEAAESFRLFAENLIDNEKKLHDKGLYLPQSTNLLAREPRIIKIANDFQYTSSWRGKNAEIKFLSSGQTRELSTVCSGIFEILLDKYDQLVKHETFFQHLYPNFEPKNRSNAELNLHVLILRIRTALDADLPPRLTRLVSVPRKGYILKTPTPITRQDKRSNSLKT